MSLTPDRDAICEGETVLLEPRVISKTFVNSSWPQPQLLQVVDGKVSIQNNTGDIISLHKNDHLCQIFKTETIDISSSSQPTPRSKQEIVVRRPFSHDVVLDPAGQLPENMRSSFKE